MEFAPDSWMALVTVWGMRVLGALAILIAGWVIGNWVSGTIKKINKLDATLKTFLGGLAKYAILAIAGVAVLGQFGVQTASLLAVLGAAGLAIGLALQGTLSNVAAGVMMLILRPFNVGDYIEAGGVGGTVKTLGLFGTELATPDNIYIFVPNQQVWSSEVKNYNRNKQRRQDIVCGVGYGEDIDKAFKVFEKAVKAEKRLVKSEGKEPIVMVTSLGDSSVNITARVWTTTGDFWNVKWDLTKSIKEALDKADVSIPFPTRTIEYAPGSNPAEAKKPANASKKKAA